MIQSASAYQYIPATYWKAAIYIRLSKEDYSSGDSVSVHNQRKILRQYAEDNDLYVVEEFVDDGFSGTNFERPSFQRLLDAIRRKEINCILTKDLSRLGRNHLEVGYYIETFFPENNVRYISVNEQYDSLRGDSDLVPFMNIFNELYAKQTSKKNRQVFESKFKSGGMHSQFISYGYIKDPLDKDHRIIDKEVSWVVEKIYDLAASGDGPFLIQQWLFNHKIESPSYRIYLKTGLYADKFQNASDELKYLWSVGTIRRVLTDEVYIGHSVHYKKRKPSYKHTKQKYLPKESWLITKNTHEAIISQEKFDEVQNVVQCRKRKNKSGEVALFAGLLRCSDCGGSLACYKRQRKTSDGTNYVCSKSTLRGPIKLCSAHYIRQDVLSNAVLERIQRLYQEAKVDKYSLAKKLLKASGEDSSRSLDKIKEELTSLEKRKFTITKLLTKIYEDRIEGVMSEDIFKTLFNNYQSEQREIDEKIERLQIELGKAKNFDDPTKLFVDAVEKLASPTELSREMLFSLIDKIVVYEPYDDETEEKKRTQRIDIYWKYIGPIKTATL